MKTITSKLYLAPVFDETRQLYKILRKTTKSGRTEPEWVESVKYVDLESKQVSFFDSVESQGKVEA